MISILFVATLQSLFAPLKQSHQRKVEKCNSLSSGTAHMQLSHMRKSTGLSKASEMHESTGKKLAVFTLERLIARLLFSGRGGIE